MILHARSAVFRMALELQVEFLYSLHDVKDSSLKKLYAISSLSFLLIASVVIAQAASVPVISILTASPSTITRGKSTAISWQVSGATSLMVSNGSGSESLTQPSPATIAPTTTTTYTLTARNAAGSTSRSVTVIVQPAAPAPPSTPPTTTEPSPTTSTTTPATNPAGTKLTACGDLTKPGLYYLANDVSSTVGCFAIDAAGITLNLNGHTITYDTGGASHEPAIEGHDCWSTTNPEIAGNCGTSHGGFEVYGGTIKQAVSASTFSPIFEFGQGNFSSAPYIHNITATFQNTGAQFYYSSYLPVGVKIENNVIYDNVTNIQKPGQAALSARSAFQGQAIYIAQDNQNPGSGDLIENNTIVGSPQGGIRTVNQHSTISGNDISMNATYANDFCADIPADYTTVTNNNCHPKSGRGFHINSNHVTVSKNTINVIELPQNAEYGGCELDGTYGVQLEFDMSFLPSPPVGVQVMGNTITATSGACEAIGLRVTGMTPAGNAAFTGNTITTTSSGAAHDFAISTDASDNEGVTFTGNTFRSRYAFVDGDWDGYNNTNIGHNSWMNTPELTFLAGDGGCDPTQHDAGAVCPASVEFTDSLPFTMTCGAESAATVTIAGEVKKCKPNQ